jgi:hypothetical protein
VPGRRNGALSARTGRRNGAHGSGAVPRWTKAHVAGSAGQRLRALRLVGSRANLSATFGFVAGVDGG